MRGIKRLLPVLIATFTTIVAAAQGSQQLRDRDPDIEAAKKLAAELQRANFHWGSLYLLSQFRISDAGLSETSYLPTGDSSGGISLSVDAPHRLYWVPRQKTIFTLEVTPAYSFFEGEDENGQFGYTVRGDAHFLLNHLYLDFYSVRQDRLQAFVSDINRLATVETREHGVAGEFKYSSRTSALFSARYRDAVHPGDRFQPEDVPVNLLDRTERNYRVSLMHKTFPLTSLFVSGERSDYGFERATYKDAARYWAGFGAVYNSGRMTVRAEAGPARLDFDDPFEEDFQGVLASLGVQRSNGRWTYGFNTARDLGFSILAGNNYFIATTVRGEVAYVATRRITLRGGSSWERDDYDNPILGQDRKDTISFTYVGVAYTPRRLRLGLDVGYYERESPSYTGDNASGIRYVVTLSFTP